MRRALRLLAVLCLAGLLTGQAIGADAKAPALTVGVVPFSNTRFLIEMHLPLIQHLRGEFGADVELVTAAGFGAFYAEAIKGGYDVAVMPAHFARLAQVEHGFVPLVRYSVDVAGLVVAAADGGITEAAHLAGKRVAVPDRLALALISVLAGLEKKGLLAGRDFTLVDTPTPVSAVLAIERGDAQAAITALAPFNQMSAEQRRNLRIVVDTGDFPSLVYVAHPRVSLAQREKLTKSLLRFGQGPAGRAFFEVNKFGGFSAVRPQDMSRLDPFLKGTRRLLAGTTAP